jgi:hypothetical protein
MDSIPSILLLLLVLAAIVLTLATLLMPLFVIAINSKCREMNLTLKKMEHMMRHGK